MKAGMAFWAGVIGAAVMVLGMWIARAVGATGFDLGYFWGSLLTGTTTTGTWILGFAITLILGGLIALIYAAFFEAIGRSNWGLGLLGGVVHLIIGGLLIGWISMVHPAIPQVISDPGYFAANYGSWSVAAFAILHLIYGTIVGGMYNPLHKGITMRRGKLTLEERAYEAEREREKVSVPPAEEGTPEERTPEDRPMKLGKGRRF
jgi:hypothetical protein